VKQQSATSSTLCPIGAKCGEIRMCHAAWREYTGSTRLRITFKLDNALTNAMSLAGKGSQAIYYRSAVEKKVNSSG
jgi:hypothetical protein